MPWLTGTAYDTLAVTRWPGSKSDVVNPGLFGVIE